VVFLFADCRLDLAARRLFRAEREVHLSPKAFELLKVLVENRPRALSKSELLDRVWPGVFVSDVSLAKVVNQIRARIGDDPRDARVVRTVHGYGYEFAAEAVLEGAPAHSESAAPAICWLVSGTREFALHDGRHVVGREPGSEVRLNSPKVSRRHAQILVSGTHVTIEDLGSKNGTLISGTRIDAPAALSDGAQLRIGPFTLTLRIDATGGATETEN
jgi:DNA-binding winged helix-turn-helix (wHTH) protein